MKLTKTNLKRLIIEATSEWKEASPEEEQYLQHLSRVRQGTSVEERLSAIEERMDNFINQLASLLDIPNLAKLEEDNKEQNKMKLTKSQLKKIIKEELDEAYGGALGPFPERYGDAHEKRRQRRQVAPDELENFLNTYVVDNPLYSLDAETSKTLFAGYAESTGMPASVEELQNMYDSLARNMDPHDRSHMADLEGGY